MDGKPSPGFGTYLNLAAGDSAIAKDADTLIIQRVPFSAQIGSLQDREFFFWQDRFIHFGTDAKDYSLTSRCLYRQAR